MTQHNRKAPEPDSPCTESLRLDRKEDIMITISTEEKSELLIEFIGEDIYRRVSENRNFFTVLSEKQYLLAFHWLDGKKVTIFASPENLLIVSNSPSISEFARNIDTPSDGILQFHEFLLEMTANDVYKLESLENMIISLEDRLLMDNSPSKNGISDIIKVRKDLLKVKRYYEQMEFLSDELAAADPSFSFIDKKFDRLLEFVLHLQEYIEAVREAYQSQIDIEQNNIMKVFTVITSIFLPLSLLAGWYGMNLQMPEYSSALAYPVVIAISTALVLVLLVIFKRKKWF